MKKVLLLLLFALVCDVAGARPYAHDEKNIDVGYAELVLDNGNSAVIYILQNYYAELPQTVVIGNDSGYIVISDSRKLHKRAVCYQYSRRARDSLPCICNNACNSQILIEKR
jgi:hypothetical protein